MTREKFKEKYALGSLKHTQKWCSVFVYPSSLEAISLLAQNHPEYQFLMCGGLSIEANNCTSLPFLPLADYSALLNLSDTNIVR